MAYIYTYQSNNLGQLWLRVALLKSFRLETATNVYRQMNKSAHRLSFGGKNSEEAGCFDKMPFELFRYKLANNMN
jgi:hypothetical protein